jgi:hypothetical protein
MKIRSVVALLGIALSFAGALDFLWFSGTRNECVTDSRRKEAAMKNSIVYSTMSLILGLVLVSSAAAVPPIKATYGFYAATSVEMALKLSELSGKYHFSGSFSEFTTEERREFFSALQVMIDAGDVVPIPMNIIISDAQLATDHVVQFHMQNTSGWYYLEQQTWLFFAMHGSLLRPPEPFQPNK